MMQTYRPIARQVFGKDDGREKRPLPEEVAIALSYNGSTQAVMMATPQDLIDFAYGFSLTEGIAKPEEIQSITVVEVALGLDVQIWLHDDAEARLSKRRRTLAGPVGCGLCGIDSLEQANRAVKRVADSPFHMTPAQIMQAVASLPQHQPLHDVTRAVHAAGFWNSGLIAVREDVGRHNALDKLAGCLLKNAPQTGAILLTSRVSIDMVQKTAAIGMPILIAVSAPTAQAVELADSAEITLIALARPDRFEVYTHTDRVSDEAVHVT